MINMNGADSISILSNFLQAHNIDVDAASILSDVRVPVSSEYVNLQDDIVYRVIVDSYETNRDILKTIVNDFVKKYNIYLGYVQKEQLKKYIDYQFPEDLETFLSLIAQDIPDSLDLKYVINTYISRFKRDFDISQYLDNLREAVSSDNKKRVYDYLVFIYSRLVGLNEYKHMSLDQLFQLNKDYLRKELPTEKFKELEYYCKSDKKHLHNETVSKFNEKYIQIMDSVAGVDDKASLIYLCLDQQLHDSFSNDEEFFSYSMRCIDSAYEKLQNHKTLVIHLRNIISGNSNIKWKLYAYLTLYAEKNHRIPEKRMYYKPWEIFSDIYKQKYGDTLSSSNVDDLKRYYRDEINQTELATLTPINDKGKLQLADYLKSINHGFSFTDCLILKSEDERNAAELSFIKNNTELVLIFTKHAFDDRKIPCPVCGSLNVSGNSYPEIGVKSWECKNPLCFERSKTNRGKRYSKKSILMQNATFDFSPENQIKKELIKEWRKDVVISWDFPSLYEMLVKYFTYPGDIVSYANADAALFHSVVSTAKRTIGFQSYDEFAVKDSNQLNQYSKFLSSDFFKLFIYKKSPRKKEKIVLEKVRTPVIMLGDCFETLSRMKENSVENMVTSPPYYNAREYSQWSNLYGYLNDMYNINLQAFRVLKEGGVFFYNIGDIFDFENTIVKSNMGAKRIPLGAYTICLFEMAGFELLDNVIWYKGEPQSNRQKNDGIYTPYYQRPMNCYEHMFIFKKPGNLIVNEDTEERGEYGNLVKFIPVIKIGAGGVNKYGHTAPFPRIVPKLSITSFSNKESYVLDPFSGSGTSVIVAESYSRKGIGLELLKDYAELSVEKSLELSIATHILDCT